MVDKMKIEDVRKEIDKLHIGDKYEDWIIEKELEGSCNEHEYNQRTRFYIYTDNYYYTIDAKEESNGDGYLGCIMSCRKPRAGEDWTRGGDLPDGKLNMDTWNRILRGIVRNEVVMLSDYIRRDIKPMADENIQEELGEDMKEWAHKVAKRSKKIL